MQLVLQIKEREANHMFRNIGKKIKGLASVLFWIQAVLYILTGIGVIIFAIAGGGKSFGMSGGIFIVLGVIAGLLIAGLGILFAWIGQFMLYGFGELIDKTAENEKNTAELLKKMESKPAAPAYAAPAYAARPAQPQQAARPAQPQQPAQGAYAPRPAQQPAPAAPAYPTQPQQPGNTNLPR